MFTIFYFGLPTKYVLRMSVKSSVSTEYIALFRTFGELFIVIDFPQYSNISNTPSIVISERETDFRFNIIGTIEKLVDYSPVFCSFISNYTKYLIHCRFNILSNMRSYTVYHSSCIIDIYSLYLEFLYI